MKSRCLYENKGEPHEIRVLLNHGNSHYHVVGTLRLTDDGYNILNMRKKKLELVFARPIVGDEVGELQLSDITIVSKYDKRRKARRN